VPGSRRAWLARAVAVVLSLVAADISFGYTRGAPRWVRAEGCESRRKFRLNCLNNVVCVNGGSRVYNDRSSSACEPEG
jgi:hypothetical protein